LAAVWESITNLEKKVRSKDRALLAVLTDGIENASGRGYTLEKLRTRIQTKIGEGNWTFVYLGAELEAWRTGEDMGIGMLNSLSWSPTSKEGVVGIFQTTSDSVDRWRLNKALINGRPRGPFFPLQLPAPQR
jgi:hypothetical protein